MPNDPTLTVSRAKSLSHLNVELTDICNLHCSYCLRDEDALYGKPVHFLSVDLLQRILRSARDEFGSGTVSFTGGEPTLHPQFKKILEVVASENFRFTVVTNGWHFDQTHPLLMANPEIIHQIYFSLDGATKESHDRWRGDGSFTRVVRAMTRCRMSGIRFGVKVTVRKDTLPRLEQFALLASRFGASSLVFTHFLPTSHDHDAVSGLTSDERAEAEHEIAILSNIFKMKVGIGIGYFNIEPGAPCGYLQGTVCNVDYTGRLTLCCNLSGYRGGTSAPDVVADLANEDLSSALPRLLKIADVQVEKRRRALLEFSQRGEVPDMYTGSPCLFCLKSFNKIPWHGETEDKHKLRSLPVLTGTTASTQSHEKALTSN